MFAIPIAFAQAPVPNTSQIVWSDNFVEARPVLTYVPTFIPKKYNKCSCIQYVKDILGIKGSLGNAWELEPNAELSVGVIVLLDEGWGHVGLITDYNTETITFSESNYIPCRYSERTINRNDPRIRGYYATKDINKSILKVY